MERGERCPQCGGELVLDPQDRPVAVSAESGRREPAEPAEKAGRRFERE